MIVAGSTARAGIESAWQIVEPGFETEPLQGGVQDLPSDPGVDETLVMTYDVGERSGQVVQALGLRSGDQVAVILLRGSLDAAIRRDAQIQTMVSGLSRGSEAVPNSSAWKQRVFDAAMPVISKLSSVRS